MRVFPVVVCTLAFGPIPATLVAADQQLERAMIKLDAVENRRLQPGQAVTFAQAEVNALAADAAQRKFRAVRNSHIELKTDLVIVSASIDFARVRKPEPFESIGSMAKFLNSQAPVRVELRVRSGGGHATVSALRADIANVPVTGTVLDFLVSKFVNPLFPEAVLNEPFELREGIDRIEVRPGALRVVMKL